MASDIGFVKYVVDQIESEYPVEFKKMFGEFVIYNNKKIVALVCDNIVFVKRTEAGRNFIGSVVEAAPYPGAKPSYLIEEGNLNDRVWMSKLIQLTENELPKPKPKKKTKLVSSYPYKLY